MLGLLWLATKVGIAAVVGDKAGGWIAGHIPLPQLAGGDPGGAVDRTAAGSDGIRIGIKAATGVVTFGVITVVVG